VNFRNKEKGRKGKDRNKLKKKKNVRGKRRLKDKKNWNKDRN